MDIEDPCCHAVTSPQCCCRSPTLPSSRCRSSQNLEPTICNVQLGAQFQTPFSSLLDDHKVINPVPWRLTVPQTRAQSHEPRPSSSVSRGKTNHRRQVEKGGSQRIQPRLPFLSLRSSLFPRIPTEHLNHQDSECGPPPLAPLLRHFCRSQTPFLSPTVPSAGCSAGMSPTRPPHQI